MNVKLLNYKIINIIHICVFYVNNKNVLQIYLYDINVYFGLNLSGFQGCFNNIHIILVTHWAK